MCSTEGKQGMHTGKHISVPFILPARIPQDEQFCRVAASDLVLLQSSYKLFDPFTTRKFILTMSFVAVTLEIIFSFKLLQKHYQVELAVYCSRTDFFWGLCEFRNNLSCETNRIGPSVQLQKKVLLFLPSFAKPSCCYCTA